MRAPEIMSSWRLRLVDYFRKTDAVALYQEFLQTQWLPAEQLQARQWQALEQLLRHAYEHVPYYRQLFQDQKLRPEDIRTMEDFRRLPVLTKDLIRTHEQELLADNREQYGPKRNSTGGSTGDPLVYYIDRRSRSAQWAAMYRQWAIGGWTPGERMIYFGGSSIYPTRMDMLERWSYVKLNNWLRFSSFEINDENLKKWTDIMRRHRVRFMHGYASSIYLMARYLEEHEITDISLVSVFTSAEPLYPRYRETIQRAFQCEVFDFYGANDGGGFAFECREHNGLHWVDERAVMEVITEHGVQACEGQSGEVISTDLLNYAMPFIRYQVGDIATVGAKTCGCGRQTQLLKSIQGRSHDFIVTPHGEKIHGLFFNYIFDDQKWVSQFHVVQEDENQLFIYVRPSGAYTEEMLSAIEDTVRKRVGTMTVRVIISHALATAASGKQKYIINKMLH